MLDNLGSMDFGQIVVLLLIAVVVGWLAGVITRGGGFGLLGDILVAFVGAFAGRYLFDLLNIDIGRRGLPGSIHHRHGGCRDHLADCAADPPRLEMIEPIFFLASRELARWETFLCVPRRLAPGNVALGGDDDLFTELRTFALDEEFNAITSQMWLQPVHQLGNRFHRLTVDRHDAISLLQSRLGCR